MTPKSHSSCNHKPREDDGSRDRAAAIELISGVVNGAPTMEQIDFQDIDKNLARRLTDGNLCGILSSIDAVNGLKILKLTNCYGIRGSGLEPLHGSTVLELLDLCPCNISYATATVIPILDSIIERGWLREHEVGSRLKWIQFPGSWDLPGEEHYNQCMIRDKK